MNPFEKTCLTFRHSRFLRNAHWIWNVVRPAYNAGVTLLGRHGLERVINGMDAIRVLPQFRCLGEVYEPEVWRHLMARVRPGDVIADVGAFIGLYAIALGHRVGRTGRIVAFEPNPQNHCTVVKHIRLNGLDKVVTVEQTAVGTVDGETWFTTDKESQNQVARESNSGTEQVPIVRLDSFFTGCRLDILKVDVEGFEEEVLAGAERLLSDPARGPRLIYIEVHPYNWHFCGTTSSSLLTRLRRQGYAVGYMDGRPVERIEDYGEIVAERCERLLE